MLLFYTSICLLLTLNAIQSYVLLAGNMKDFRSIAQQFVPKQIASDDADISAVSVIKYREDSEYEDDDSMDSTDYTGESQQNSQQQSFEISTQSYQEQPNTLKPKTPKETNNLNVEKIRTVMTLDEVVEKVKQRLQDEMLNSQQQMPRLQQDMSQQQLELPRQQQQQQLSQQQRVKYSQNGVWRGVNGPAAQALKQPTQAEQYAKPEPEIKHYENPESAEQATEYQEPVYEDENTLSPQPKRVERPSQSYQQINKKKRQNKTPSTNRYNELVTSHQNIDEYQELDDINVKKERQQFRKPKKLSKPEKSKHPTTESDTPNNGDIFKSVDMLKNHDSYDEYVIPPKDDIFTSGEKEVSKPRHYADVKTRSTPRRLTSDEVTTFSPRRLTAKRRPTNTMTKSTKAAEEHFVIPLNTNNGNAGDVYEDDETEGTTLEPKARTENMSTEKSEETPVDPDDTTITEAIVKGKRTVTKKIGTMIPKRDFYKQSSPNYYANLPVVAEKYNFEEPIPEKDREPENLKPFGNPPASINGKILLL